MVSLNTVKDWVTRHWFRLVIVIVLGEAIIATIWWFKPKFPTFLARKPSVTYSFKSAPKDTGFALLSDNTKSGGFKALIGKKDAAGIPEARFEVEKGWMEFALAGGTDVRSFESQKKDGKDTIIWKNVLTDTDARYQIVETGLKEDIILKSDFLAQRAIDEKDKVTISFDLTTFNVLPRTDTSGKLGLAFMDASSGDYRFHIEPPYLVDSAGVRFDAINYKLEPVGVADGSLFKENIAVGKDEVKHHDPDARIKSEHKFVDTAKFKIHVSSPTFFAKTNPTLAQIMTTVNPTTMPIASETENRIPVGSKNFKTTDANMSFETSNQNSVSFLSSYVDRTAFAIDRLFAPYYHIRSFLAKLQGTTLRKAFAAPPAGNKWRLTLTLPKEWLADPSRAYPVILDPTVTHNTQTAFATGTLNRVKDEGTGDSAPILIGSYHELPADINTVGLWHMNENAANTCTGGVNDVCDKSGNSNDGAFNGNAAFTTTSKFGASAVTFDGTGDYISFGDKADFNQQSFTLEAWFKTTSAATQTVIAKQDETGGDRHYRLTMAGGTTPTLETYTGTVTIVCNLSGVAGNYNDGNWHHIGVVSTDSSAGTECTIYMDGKFNARTTSTSRIDSSAADLRIGDMVSPAAGFNGQIDEVRFSSIARTPEEIKQDAQRFPYSIFTSPVMDLTQSTAWNSMTWLGKGINTGDGETLHSTNSLVAQWNFNETSGTTAVSGGSCGTSCNGTLTNMTTSGQDAAANSGWTANNRRWGAGSVMTGGEGSDDYITVPDNIVFRPTSDILTVETWINTMGNNEITTQIIDKGARALGSGFGSLWSIGSVNLAGNCTSNTVNFAVRTGNAGGATQYCVKGTDLDDSNWHHVVGIRNTTYMAIYIDGVLKEEKSDATNPGWLDNLNGPLFFGVYSSGNNSHSSTAFDTTRIYNRALTAAEILANYQAGNVELQTRTSADNATWEAWKPVTGETQLASLDEFSATGGTITYSNGYKIHTFTSSGTFTPNGSGNVEYLVVGGGGGGGSSGGQFSGGGGAGGFRTGTGYAVTAQAYTITVGAGGAVNTVGSNSVFDTITSLGGGSGGIGQGAGPTSGGSGGGGLEGVSGAAGTAGQGNAGGNGTANDSGGGGGGAGGVGSSPGTGGAGTASSISGSSITYAGGGGGSARGLAYSGGAGGGGNGAYYNASIAATAGTTNSGGGGGGGAASSAPGKAGGSGVVLIRYPFSTSTSPNSLSLSTDTTTKMEGSGSLKAQIGAPQVDTSTVALWHMEETSGTGAYIKDATANANHGTPTGTSTVDGFYGKARSFNGTSDYVDIGTGSSLDVGGGNFSVELWFKHNMSTNDKSIMEVGGFTNKYMAMVGAYTGAASGSQVDFCYNGSFYHSIGSNLNDNKWHQFTTTRSGSTMTFYIDGVATSASGPGGCTNGTANRLGTGNYTGYTGSIDEVRISNTARTAEEIAEAYRAGRDHRLSKTLSSNDLSSKTKLPFYVASDRPGTFLEATVGESAYANYEPDANTVGLWHLEEQSGSGAYVKDSSGSGNNGTPTGTTFVQGKLGKARSFNGSSNYVDVGTGPSVKGLAQYTLDTWFYVNTMPGSGTADTIYSEAHGTSSSVRAKIIISNAEPSYGSVANSLVFRFRDLDANSPINLVSGANAISAGQWYHTVAAYDSTNDVQKLYLNGALVASATNSMSSVENTAPNVTNKIGAEGTGASEFFDGITDEVRISNTARTADEIRQAYEIGKRTHPVTIDFVTSPQAAYSSGTSVTINNPWGTTNLTDTLSVGDTMIFKENVGGTETVGQATVNAITNTSSVYGTVTLDAAPSFPSGGYSTNAKVFKWQREYMDLTGSLSTHRDAITRLTMRVTDGSQGSNVWLDDFRSNTNYINDNTPDSFNTATGVGTYSTTSIPSTLNRYFQYRAILSSWDTAVSPQFTSATLDYTSNATPAAPTVSAPTDAATNQKFRPVIQAAATDSDSDYLRYKIQIATDTGFTTGLQTFDQTVSQTGWSGQNASTSTGYSSGTTASYTIQSVLSTGATYYVRAYAKDPVGSDTWSSASTTKSFTVVDIPTAAAATSVEISSFTMNWSGPATYTSYRLDVSTASDFSSYVTDFQNKTVAGTSDSITGLNLATGATYYYRVRGVDSNGDTSANSATITARLGICNPNTSGAYTATSSCRFENTYDGVQEGNFMISAGKTVTLNAGQRIAWTPGNSITINTGSSIAIAAGAQLVQGYVVYPDTDGDLYASSTTATVSATTVPSGFTKRALVRTFAFTDRNDNNTAAYESRPLLDSSGNYGGWSGSDATAATLSTDSSTTYLSSMGAMQAVMTTVNTGTGADGALSVTTGTTTINTTLSGTLAGTGAATTATVASTTGFAAGNEVLLVQMTGTGAGNYEYRTISAVNSATQVTFTAAKTNTYTNDGTSKAQMIKVPQYTTVDVSAGATLTAGAWDGTTGGVLVFRATGTVSNAGTIDMNGKGFAGGSGAGGGGGGGGMSVSCSQGTKNTNWGSSSPGSSAGSVGTGIGAGSGGGGAGGLGGRANAGGGAGGGGGGGGGYAAAGTAGGGGSSSVGSWNCPVGTNGRNNGFTTAGGSAGAAGSTTYGATNLATVFLGSGGGGGAAGAGADGGACDCDANLDKSCNGGGSGSGGSGATGGTGGGIIVIIANTVTNSGTIRSNGSNGSNGTGGSNGGNPSTSGGCDVWASGGGSGAGGAGGGGGSGGSILLQSSSVTVGTVTASGGSGGSAGSSPGTIANGAGGCYGDGYCGGPGAAAGSGGAGAVGRIRIDNSGGNATGSSPAPYTAALPSPLNVTMNRTLSAPIDLSGINHVSFWVNSAVTGSVLRFQMGEAAVGEQTFDFTVSAANTWEEKAWDISAISAASRNAIQYMQFKYLSGTSGTFRIDGLTYYE